MRWQALCTCWIDQLISWRCVDTPEVFNQMQAHMQEKKNMQRENDEPAISLSLPSVRHKGPPDGILFIRQTSERERERARNKSTSSQAHADSGAAYIKIRGKSGIIRCAAENVEGIQIPHACTRSIFVLRARCFLSEACLSLCGRFDTERFPL